jgi:protein-disulfide isomerase
VSASQSWRSAERMDEREERALFRRRASTVDPAGVPSLASVLRVVDADGGGADGARATRGARPRWIAIAAGVAAAACCGYVTVTVTATRFLHAGARSPIAADGPPASGLAGASATSDGNETVAVPVAGAPARGPARASITIVEFADFECPFCARAEVTLRALELAHPGDLRVVYKNLPLPMHPHARLAAKAALAADAQGRFWEFHDRLYAQLGRRGEALDRAMLERIAADLQLDGARFSRDLGDPALEGRIAGDEKDAAALGVEGTPTFFVNGRRISGAYPIAVFEAVIAKAAGR